MTGPDVAGMATGPALPEGARRLGSAPRPEWWARLDDLAQPPSELWMLGRVDPCPPAVAVVGSRRASAHALRAGRRIGRDLAAHGIQVLSGLALGVDGEAHRGALEGGGTTVAVLGCGIDTCYPSTHRGLHADVVRRGSILTEEAPGTPPLPYLFPKRNRIIAALADAVVVVEAGPRSGALSTARHAAELGREVLACPANYLNEGALGSNLLLRDGATPYLGVTSLLDAVPALAAVAAVRPEAAAGGPGRDTVEGRLVALLGGGSAHPDELLRRLGVDARTLSTLLGRMEAEGFVTIAASGLVSAESSPRV
ncbi:MAG TPA: DNA-processing protein DprA [Candidatus Dormibacteraeota bacterium]|nr:DNA-processing protein DprA [Candidatus Dormibacteraeota bacterium]